MTITNTCRSALVLTAASLLSCAAFAQGDEVQMSKVQGNVYEITGPDGNVGVMVGGDGIIMVDSKNASVVDAMLDEIRKVSDAPIRFLINTHIHPDHIGGNEKIQKETHAIIMSKTDLREKMVEQGAKGLPMLTYDNPVTLHVGDSPTLVIPLPPAHTATDTMIYFTGADVLYIGDVFRATGFHSISGGGSWKGSLEALSQAIQLIGPNTKVVPGHGKISTRKDLIDFRDMVSIVGTRIQGMIDKGMSLDEVLEAEPTKDYRDKFPTPKGFGSPEGMVKGIYQHLTQK